MIIKMLLPVFLFFSVLGWAQKDSPFKSPKIKLNWDIPVKSETKSNTISLPFKSVLDKDTEALLNMTDLEEETIEEVKRILSEEFED